MAKNEIPVHLNLYGERKVQKGLNDTGNAAEKAGDQLEEMGDQATTAGKAGEKAGEKFKATGDDLGHLNKQIVLASANYQRLIRAFDATGDTSLIKDINKERRNLRRFQNLAKELIPDEAAAGLGQQVMKGIATAAQAAGPVKLALGGLGVAAAPLIGGAVAAAVLGGVGAGGIAGGIALAAQDPAVAAEAEKLAASVGAAFSTNGETFVEPVVASLDKLATTGVEAASKLRPGMDALASTIEPLADGIDGLVDNALPGLTQGMKAAVPVVRFLASELPGLGQSVGDFIAKVSEDPDGAILALGTLIDTTERAIDGAGNLVVGLSEAYEWSVRAAENATGFVDSVFGWVPGLGHIVGSTNEDLREMLGELDNAKVSSDDLATSTERVTYHTYELGVAADGATESLVAQREAMSNLVDLELAAVSGTIAFERAIDSLAEARKENGKAVGTETEAERRNTEEILRGIQAVKENAEREYELAIQHGATAQEAEEAARAYRDKFGAELRAQIIRLFGNTEAVKALLAELEKLNGKRIVYTVVQQGGRTIGFKADGGIQLKDDQGIYRRASGGPVAAGRPYWVGEQGPELVTFGADGYVHNAAASKAMTTGASGGAAAGVAVGAAPVVTVRFIVDGADEDMKRLVRRIVKVDGGGSVQVAFGEN